MIPILAAICLLFLTGFTQIHNNYKDEPNINDEFQNVYQQAQGKFTTVNATPTLTELGDGEFVIFSSNTVKKLMFRSGVDIFQINVSCITVFR